MASLRGLLLYSIPFLVTFAGFLAVHFWEPDLLAPFSTYETQEVYPAVDDKMGGGGEYRSVVYFVNVGHPSQLAFSISSMH